MLVCGSNVRPKSDATGVLKFFDVYTAEAEPELGEWENALLVAAPKVLLYEVNHLFAVQSVPCPLLPQYEERRTNY